MNTRNTLILQTVWFAPFLTKKIWLKICCLQCWINRFLQCATIQLLVRCQDSDLWSKIFSQLHNVLFRTIIRFLKGKIFTFHSTDYELEECALCTNLQCKYLISDRFHQIKSSRNQKYLGQNRDRQTVVCYYVVLYVHIVHIKAEEYKVNNPIASNIIGRKVSQ